jgi:hypothetical protein
MKTFIRSLLGKALTGADGLSMKEVVGEFMGRNIGPTFLWGSKPIDGVWAMADVEISNACIIPVGYGVGDHCMFIVDIVKSSLVGKTPFRVQRVVSRRLNTKTPGGGAAKYIATLKSSIDRHRLIERLGQVHKRCQSKKDFHCQINKIDRESKELMKHAEKVCRQIKSGQIPFSPEAALWIRHALVYRSLLPYHLGLIRNRGNLKRRVRQCEILNCLSIPVPELCLRLRAVTKHCNFYQKNGKCYQTKHLYKCLANAREAQQETREREILAIIQRKKDCSFWRWINFAMGKKRGGLVCRIITDDPNNKGQQIKHTTQVSVQEAIFDNIHRLRFFLAESMPICQGRLRGGFGYNTISSVACTVLDGTFVYPNDFDEAKKEICWECAAIWALIPLDSMIILLTKED